VPQVLKGLQGAMVLMAAMGLPVLKVPLDLRVHKDQLGLIVL
jgi:hypothetical protein